MQTSEYEIHVNGSAPPTGPRIPRREQWLDLPEDAYPGFKIRCWVNYPRRLVDQLASGDSELMRRALLQIVLEHNNWHDFEGNPLSPANTEDFWHEIPDEIAVAIIALFSGEVGKLGASIRARSGR